MPVIFSHSKFITFTVQTAAQQADIVALRLPIAAADRPIVGLYGGPPVSQPVAGRRLLAGHRLTDWAKQVAFGAIKP